MESRKLSQGLSWACTGLMLAGSAAAAEAPEAFSRLYLEPIRQAKASPETQDDLALARKMLAAAKQPGCDPALLAATCRGAYELAAAAPEGAELAVEAMALLRKADPNSAAECDKNVLAVRQRQYAAAEGRQRSAAGRAYVKALDRASDSKAAAGDYAEAYRLAGQAARIAAAIDSRSLARIQAKARRLAAMEMACRQVPAAEAKLKADPNDPQARRDLIELHLIELNSPANAAAFLADGTDEVLRTYVPLAARDVRQLAPQACLELGRWYQHGLAPKGTAAGRTSMLVRARAYYRAFLRRADKDDPARAQASLALAATQAELEKLGIAPAGGQWTDVLKTVVPARHAHVGKWERKGMALHVAARGHCRVTIPVMPRGSYELDVRFVRSAGTNDVNVILPVGGAAVVLMFSNGNGTASGLSTVNTRMCDHNETRAPGTLANDKPYTIHVKVTPRKKLARITATLNGKRYVNWEGPQAALGCGGWVLPNPATLGLGVDNGSTVTFQSVRLRMLSGEAVPAPPLSSRRGSSRDSRTPPRR